MEITSKFNKQTQTPNFKKGLTSTEINAVRRMDQYEHANIAERLKTRYGIDAEFGGCNTVAWCVEQIAEIMTKAGFKLPKAFVFCPLNDVLKDKPLGIYLKEEDAVCINADYSEFTDLTAQNELEEAQGNFHPTTKHFLHTYLHEFSHAAHFNNICSNCGEERSIKIFENDLANYSPNEVIVGPMNALIRSKLPIFLDKIVNAVIPPANGLYALTNLKEYFAEKNAKKISVQLGDSYNTLLVKNIASEYQTHPYNWDVLDEFKKLIKPKSAFAFLESDQNLLDYANIVLKSILLFNKDIKYVDGDIFHGTINSSSRISYFRRHS